MILILSDEFDTHADAVQKELERVGETFFRLNLNVESLKKTRLSSNAQAWNVLQQGKEFTASAIKSVWARRLSVSQTLEQQYEENTPAKQIWKGEWNRALFGLYSSLRQARWMNPIQPAMLAENKFYQAAVARSVGLQVPETVMSNDRHVLASFAARAGAVALKFLSQDIYQLPDKSYAGLYVNKLSAKDLESFGGVAENPIVLQTYVPKMYEVRYTVIDQQHFACAIYSQASERAAVDWRRYDIPHTPHAAIEPPSAIAERVAELMNRLDLRYGALDFIVDEDGQWHFLEVNTAGQWLWIEDLVGLPISASLAKALRADEGAGE